MNSLKCNHKDIKISLLAFVWLSNAVFYLLLLLFLFRVWKAKNFFVISLFLPNQKFTPGSGCSNPDYADPGLARILISVLWLFVEVFCLHCLSFSLELE